MSDNYFVIYQSGDGDWSVDQLTHEEMQRRLNEDHYGPTASCVIGNPKSVGSNGISGIFIVRGSIVHPRAVKTVEHWEI